MHEKYNNNALKACWTISAFYIIITLIIGSIVRSSNLLFATDIIFIITIVVMGLIVPIILCALKIYLYLTDEMKQARIEERSVRS